MASVALETASDEWFADFDDDGLPELAVGRLPVRSVEQAEALVRKIVGYEIQPVGAWTSNVTLVADANDAWNDFEAASRNLAPLLPRGYQAHEVFRGPLGNGAGTALAAQVTEGRLHDNYQGHGSTRLWGQQGDLLSNDLVRSSWHSDMRLPFVVAMNCLNGFFHSIYDEESLAEALLRRPDGGAVAAWASSSLTASATQQLVNHELFRLLFRDGTLTLGEAAARAKRVVTHSDVRRSWIFFGDPATRLLGVQPGPEAGLVAVDPTTTAATLSAADPTPIDEVPLVPAEVRRVRLADFDGDGRADRLGYRPDTGAWQVWTAASRVLDQGAWALGLDVQAADFDDQRADLFLYDPLSGAWFQLVNTGAGFVATAGTTIPEADVRLGDFDGDGSDDVLLYQPSTGDWSMGVTTASAYCCARTDRL